MNIRKISKIILTAIIAFSIVSPALAQSIPTVSPWMYFGGSTKNIRPVATTTKVLIGASATTTGAFLETPSAAITGLPGEDCLGTDGDGVLTTGTCSSGSGNVSTSSVETATYIPFWTSSGASPALLSGGENTFTYDAADNKLAVTNASTTALTAVNAFFTNVSIGVDTLLEYISDAAGSMWSGNTETGLSISYQDGDNTIDAVCNTADTNTFGCLTDTDWDTFNGKQAAGNYITALTGDVTASGPGSVAATIADNAVDGTDISLTSEAAGDIMFFNGTSWEVLPLGTAGQVLEVNAGETAPEWDTDDSGAGGSEWTDAGDYVFPNEGDYIEIPFLSATSSYGAATSTFAHAISAPMVSGTTTGSLLLRSNSSSNGYFCFESTASDGTGVCLDHVNSSGTGSLTVYSGQGGNAGNIRLGQLHVGDSANTRLLLDNSSQRTNMTSGWDFGWVGDANNAVDNSRDIGLERAGAGVMKVNDGSTGFGDVTVADEAYDATAWNGSQEVPTKNALRDKIETLGGAPGGNDTEVQFNDGGVFAGDTAFTWNKTNDTISAGDNSLTNFSLAKGLWGFSSTTPTGVTGFERVIFEDEDGGKSDWSFRVAGGAYGVTNFAGSNGSLGTPATSTDTDTIGAVEFLGYDGTDYEQAAAIRGIVDGTPGANDMPGALHFMTTADGAGSPTDRVILDSAGVLKPATNDGAALGNGTLKWSDLFLASGSLLNWNNGDLTLTHSADTLTLAGGSLVLSTPLGIASGGLNAAFTDPNADRLMFWDDSAGSITGIATLTGAAISGTTLTINDVTCTDCLGTTEIADSYMLNTGDTSTGAVTINNNNGAASTLLTIGDSNDLDSIAVFGDVTVADEAYGSGWNASLEVPTKNAVYDKVETLVATPPGVIMPYASSTAPTGYLVADGTAVSRATYAALFAVIGTTYGAGDGSTTFNLPNLKGRIPVGLDGAQTEFDAMAETGGAKTHTLTLAEIPAHTHTVNTSGASADIESGAGAGGSEQSGSAGGGGAHNNLQPYVVVTYIIKT